MYTQIFGEQFRIYIAERGEKGLKLLQQEDIRIILLALRLPDMNGMDVLRQVKAIDEHVDIIVTSGDSSTHTINDALQLGACAYLLKPFTLDTVLLLLRQTLERQQATRHLLYLRSEIAHQDDDLNNLVGQSEKMSQIYNLIDKVADTRATVLIEGEHGTEKEQIARALHRRSQRREKPFVAMNCAAMSEVQIENALFGHERERVPGKLERAHTGTLFLDEIGSLSSDMQTKLLQVLQERTFKRVRGTKMIRIDVRIVAASHENLFDLVKAKSFHEALYYRLNVIWIQVPPLRERKRDIPLLINHFLTKYNRAFNRDIQGLNQSAMQVLTHYRWPGNTHELKNIIERLVLISSSEVLDVADLPIDLMPVRNQALDDLFSSGASLKEASAEFDRQYILQALKQSDWNRTMAAKRLGIHRNTLMHKLEALDIREVGPDVP